MKGKKMSEILKIVPDAQGAWFENGKLVQAGVCSQDGHEPQIRNLKLGEVTTTRDPFWLRSEAVRNGATNDGLNTPMIGPAELEPREPNWYRVPTR